MTEERKQTEVEKHIDRCIEIYGTYHGADYFSKPVDRADHEQMRNDLMIALGMLAAMQRETRG